MSLLYYCNVKNGFVIILRLKFGNIILILWSYVCDNTNKCGHNYENYIISVLVISMNNKHNLLT